MFLAVWELGLLITARYGVRLSGNVISETHPQAGSAYDALITATSPCNYSPEEFTRGSQGPVGKIVTSLNSWD